MARGLAGLVAWLLPLAAFAAPPAAPVQLYRYLDDRGVTVLDRQGVPPEFVSKGYQILNAQGRVLQTIAPAPTEQEAQAAATHRAQAQADAKLRARYTGVDDLERTRQRQLAEIDGQISVVNANLQTLQAQQASLQGEAASQERNGQAVSPMVLDQLEALRQHRVELNAQVQRYQQMRADTDRAFTADRARLQQLMAP
jgi:chromosome segregation ATPase